MAKGLDEDILRQFLGVVVVANGTQEIAVDLTGMTVDQFFKPSCQARFSGALLLAVF
jgi:hypothetical protein